MLITRGAPRLDLYGTNTIPGGIAVETGTLYMADLLDMDLETIAFPPEPGRAD